ncbi:hypothetical protein [Thermocrispum municipale]|uniref:hypothetical protein n=1 Tax=Thermocrispum municipale TaxID=37926 RepID=UPI0004064C76|nr:hypothetical protein [Thermocrispum municipale]
MREEGGTTLVLSHSFDDRPGAASFTTGWEQCLAGLAESLDGRAPTPPEDRGEARHEELVELFGLDRPTISTTGTGWRLRFERQLICTAEAAWDLAVGPSALAVGEKFRSPVAPEVMFGTVAEVEPPRALALTTAPGRPGDAVRLTLGEGTGHGARLMLEVSGTDPDERDDAVPAWGADVLARIVREVARLAGVR